MPVGLPRKSRRSASRHVCSNTDKSPLLPPAPPKAQFAQLLCFFICCVSVSLLAWENLERDSLGCAWRGISGSPEEGCTRV